MYFNPLLSVIVDVDVNFKILHLKHDFFSEMIIKTKIHPKVNTYLE